MKRGSIDSVIQTSIRARRRAAARVSPHRRHKRRGHALECDTISILPGDEYAEGLGAWRVLRHIRPFGFSRRKFQLGKPLEYAIHDGRAKVKGATADANPQGILDTGGGNRPERRTLRRSELDRSKTKRSLGLHNHR